MIKVQFHTGPHDEQNWVLKYGSGSLKQALGFGMAWRKMYLHERAAMEIGWGAEFIPVSRITTGKFMAQPDCPITTHLGWFTKCILNRWPEDRRFHKIINNGTLQLEIVYYKISEEVEREGAGIVIHGLDWSWIPENHVVLLNVAEFINNQWKMENPL